MVVGRPAGKGERVRRRVGRILLGAGRAVLPETAVCLPLEHPTSSTNAPRWGHGRPNHPFLEALLAEHRESYRETLSLLRRFGDDLAGIDVGPRADLEPAWTNPTIWGLDAAAIYCFLRSRTPARYVEIGSGESTKFAARAKRDGGLETYVTSVDPQPRAPIDALCDEPVRRGLEQVPLSTFEELRAGDVVFHDGTHRLFMNSDVTTFFLDVLPRLDAGVLVGVHDIFLPEDYGLEAADMYWSEAYALAIALLLGPDRLRPVLASHYVWLDPLLRQACEETWRAIGLEGIFGYGSTFWFETE